MDNISFICNDFQQKIVNVFNDQEQLPFLLKYFLFKEIWEKIQQKKFQNDYEVQAVRTQRKETLTTKVPLSEDLLQKESGEEE